MKNTLGLLAGLGVLAVTQTGWAAAGGVGVIGEGVVFSDGLTQGALGVEFDKNNIQIDALLSAASVDNGFTHFGLQARFFYAMQRNERADLGLGAGIGTFVIDAPRTDATLGLNLLAGGRARVFLVPNVALTFFMGMNMIFVENASAFGLG